MASMNRNVNLEEIDTDSFMGISYLKYQRLSQKIIFLGGIAIALAINIIGTFVFDASINVTLALAIVPLLLGIAFGCNYNEDYSLIRYIILVISKPSKAYYSKPYEDLEQLHNAAERIKEEEELLQKQQERMSDDGQQKLLMRMVIVGVIFVVIIVAAIIIINLMKTDEVHHTVMRSIELLERTVV
jgi:hypothetical protein